MNNIKNGINEVNEYKRNYVTSGTVRSVFNCINPSATSRVDKCKLADHLPIGNASHFRTSFKACILMVKYGHLKRAYSGKHGEDGVIPF